MRIKIIIAGILLACLGATAQNTTSPYSRFGYGLLNDNATSLQTQMGGVGYAMTSGRQVNMMNPAAPASTDSLTFLFDIGLTLNYVDRREGDNKGGLWGGGLDYVTMQFPIAERFGMSLGLLPYSSVGYSFGSEVANGSSTMEGVGGLNQLYAGFAGRIVDGLQVGASISYLFGTTFNDVYANTTGSVQSLFEQVMQVRDFHLQFGIQYGVNLTPDHRLTAGVTYSPGKTLLGHTWIQQYEVGSDQDPDTLNYSSMKGRFSLPSTWGVGLNYQWRNQLMAEVDFTYQDWSKAKFDAADDFTSTRFTNRYKVAAGAQFTPAQRGNYLQRMSYRIGAHWTRDYVMVGSNHVREIGASLGFGFPAPGQKTVVNLGFDWINRQALGTGLLRENYVCLRLGINFNQLWFMQNKIN